MTRPVSVVTTDQRALVDLLGVHAVDAPRILDVTYNTGKMWKGLDFAVTSSDSNPALPTDYHDDFRALSHADASFDVIVYDPPHLTHAGGNGVMGGWAETYGLHESYHRDNGPTAAYGAFLGEAKRVLVPNGIVLAKICDQVHGAIYQWQAFAFIQAAQAAGMTACDMQIKVRKSGLIDPKWKNVYHVRKVHTYWLVIRNGLKCMRLRERPLMPLELSLAERPVRGLSDEVAA